MINETKTTSKSSDSGNFLIQGSILAAAGIIVRLIGFWEPKALAITILPMKSTTLD